MDGRPVPGERGRPDSDRRDRVAQARILSPVPGRLRRRPIVDGTAATDAADVDDESSIAPVAEIVAAIELVRHGLATRVSLSGFAFTPDLVREAIGVAHVAGCRAMPEIGGDGRLGLVVSRRVVPGG